MARRLANAQEAADYIGVDQRTVRRWIASGHLTGYRLGGHTLRVDLDEVDTQLCQPIPTAKAAGQ